MGVSRRGGVGVTTPPTPFGGSYIVKKGSNGCVRAMVSSRPSQNQKRKARAAKTEEGKTVCNCLKVMI